MDTYVPDIGSIGNSELNCENMSTFIGNNNNNFQSILVSMLKKYQVVQLARLFRPQPRKMVYFWLVAPSLRGMGAKCTIHVQFGTLMEILLPSFAK